MDCPDCGTWNPDDKIRCWRCGAALPEPPPRRKRRAPISQTWIWVIGAILLVLTAIIRCNLIDVNSTTRFLG